MTHPVNSQTSVPLATRAGWRSGRRGRANREANRDGTRPARWATAPARLRASSRRWWPSTPVAGPVPPRDETRRVGEGLASPFHQPAEGHPRRAGHLARPALHAAPHEVGERSVERCPDLHVAHGRDPAPGRRRFLTGDPVGRAEGQAQPARHALGQLVGVDRQPPEHPAHPAGAGHPGHTGGPSHTPAEGPVTGPDAPG